MLSVTRSSLRGEVRVPASKSHTIRGVILSTLGEGTSVLYNPLEAADTLSAVQCCEALGATIERSPDRWTVKGIAGRLPTAPQSLNVGNSGTTLGNLIGVCAAGNAPVSFDGDASIRTRPFGPLLASLEQLGAMTASTGPRGTAPLTVHGPIQGGQASVDGTTSIYLTPLLVGCPLASKAAHLAVDGTMNEQGYVRMTMDWLAACGVAVTANDGLTQFDIPGGQRYRSVERTIAADFSSAAFPTCAAVLAAGEDVVLHGLDFGDTQGDKVLFDFLSQMGASFEVDGLSVTIHPHATLKSLSIDLSGAPDALPILAVLGCVAEGTTELINAAMARIKETDRIAVMYEELSKMGADIQMRPDGLVIHQSELHGADVNGHNDHRVVMALAVAGLVASGTTRIESAECVQVTYPSFVSSMRELGAQILAEG